MRKSLRMIFLVLTAGLLLLQVACAISDPASVPSGDEQPVATPTEKGRATKVDESSQVSAPPGIACMGSAGNGVTCLDENGWQIYTHHNSPLGGDYVKDMAVCPDGGIMMLHLTGISAFDGEAWQEYEAGWGSSGAEAVACNSAGDLWVAHFRGVSRLDIGGWTTFPAERLATGDAATSLVRDVAVASDGMVWVLTASSVARFDGETWTRFQDFQEKPYFGSLAVDHFDRPWAGYGGGVLNFRGGAWQTIPKDELLTVESLAVDQRGRPWVGTFSGGVFFYQDGGWVSYDRGSSELGSNRVRDLAIDGRGRVWMGTEWGLTVVDGEKWRGYRMDNAGLGDNDISALAVVRGGPSLPEPMAKAPGTLKGRATLDDGTAIASARVELCVEGLAGARYKETPCSDQVLVRGGETDSDGSFSISDLPAAYYAITVETRDGWVVFKTESGGSTMRVLVAAGEERDLGEIVLALVE